MCLRLFLRTIIPFVFSLICLWLWLGFVHLLIFGTLLLLTEQLRSLDLYQTHNGITSKDISILPILLVVKSLQLNLYLQKFGSMDHNFFKIIPNRTLKIFLPRISLHALKNGKLSIWFPNLSSRSLKSFVAFRHSIDYYEWFLG